MSYIDPLSNFSTNNVTSSGNCSNNQSPLNNLQEPENGSRETEGLSNSGQAERDERQTDSASIFSAQYKDSSGNSLTDAEISKVKELEARDREVRQHEMAHVAAGGRYVRSGAVYSYQTAPDGKRYVVGGEVSIDTSEASNPESTISKMQAVRRAALAPVDPSAQDRAVAAKAAMVSARAQTELIEMRRQGSFQTENSEVNSYQMENFNSNYSINAPKGILFDAIG